MITTSVALERHQSPERAGPRLCRDHLISLVERVAPMLGLSHGATHIFRIMASLTKPRDWTTAGGDPCCYAAQVELARVAGVSTATLRRHEAGLVAAGLVGKRVAANGSRSSRHGCGIFFGPTIRRAAKFQSRLDDLEAVRHQHASLRGLRSIHKRHLNGAIAAMAAVGHPSASHYAQVIDEWPDAGQLHRMDISELAAHVEAADNSSREAVRIVENIENSSVRPLNFERPYIQDTTQEESLSCSAPHIKRNAGKPAQDNLDSDASADAPQCKEKDDVGRSAACKSEFLARLGPQRLYELAGDGFQMYLDARSDREQLTFHDFVVAAHHVMRDRGINHSAWIEAMELMSEDEAMICVLIIDAKCSDPTIRIASPGGYLRAMVRARSADKLNLVGSLIGLSERRRDMTTA
ncbi:hypothetical protein FQV27_17255 [Paracoccus aurantiacus]|uniref:Uncharacterized protein n=1 Tax=Paracoccus aurantiacus TaxID=2599412 RepID=A0A5C6RSW6_9RHOB|nr:replication initiation protein RepC [Paracoccus aurantiacus]TXB65044.1 hypothetical protein FQV27_17255 [Paracoccus aurantiacus]